jgi:hypothetical protein
MKVFQSSSTELGVKRTMPPSLAKWLDNLISIDNEHTSAQTLVTSLDGKLCLVLGYW